MQWLDDPSGTRIASDEQAMPRNRATRYRAVGRSRPADGWAPGVCFAEVAIRRGDDVLAVERRSFRID